METEESTLLPEVNNERRSTSSSEGTLVPDLREELESARLACSGAEGRAQATSRACHKMMNTITEVIDVLQTRSAEFGVKARAMRQYPESVRYYSDLARRYNAHVVNLLTKKNELLLASRSADEAALRARNMINRLLGLIEQGIESQLLEEALECSRQVKEVSYTTLKKEYDTVLYVKDVWDGVLTDKRKIGYMQLPHESRLRCKDASVAAVNIFFMFTGFAALLSLSFPEVRSECLYPILVTGIFDLVFSLAYGFVVLHANIMRRREEVVARSRILTENQDEEDWAPTEDCNPIPDINPDWLEILERIQIRINSLEFNFHTFNMEPPSVHFESFLQSL